MCQLSAWHDDCVPHAARTLNFYIKIKSLLCNYHVHGCARALGFGDASQRDGATGQRVTPQPPVAAERKRGLAFRIYI